MYVHYSIISLQSCGAFVHVSICIDFMHHKCTYGNLTIYTSEYTIIQFSACVKHCCNDSLLHTASSKLYILASIALAWSMSVSNNFEVHGCIMWIFYSCNTYYSYNYISLKWCICTNLSLIIYVVVLSCCLPALSSFFITLWYLG